MLVLFSVFMKDPGDGKLEDVPKLGERLTCWKVAGLPFRGTGPRRRSGRDHMRWNKVPGKGKVCYTWSSLQAGAAFPVNLP